MDVNSKSDNGTNGNGGGRAPEGDATYVPPVAGNSVSLADRLASGREAARSTRPNGNHPRSGADHAFPPTNDPATSKPEPLKPTIPIKKTVTNDYLISLEDGKKYKTLKRHLALQGLTPDAYRQKWNLPDNYPMVAPAYSARRSELAKKLGLGRKPAAKKPVAKRGRPKASR